MPHYQEADEAERGHCDETQGVCPSFPQPVHFQFSAPDPAQEGLAYDALPADGPLVDPPAPTEAVSPPPLPHSPPEPGSPPSPPFPLPQHDLESLTMRDPFLTPDLAQERQGDHTFPMPATVDSQRPTEALTPSPPLLPHSPPEPGLCDPGSGSPPFPEPELYLDALMPCIPAPSQVEGSPSPTCNTSEKQTTRKTIPLSKGNLVHNLDVPQNLQRSSSVTEEESRVMTYSAATCSPDEFKNSGFTLRQQKSERRTELLIIITLYNEDEDMFCGTMDAVRNNIEGLCGRSGSDSLWGPDAWKKVVVCIVADGRTKINCGTLDVLTAMGVHQPGVAQRELRNKEITAHIYEYSTKISVPKATKVPQLRDIPLQIIFCLKETNMKKLNSHRWAFYAFAPILQPNICVLLDVGTVPSNLSIYHLWRAFENNENVAGACGEIVALKHKDQQKGGRKYKWNPLVAAQHFEYKMSNILDKALESVFGYVTVLPGAFSAYRYKALRNDAETLEGPLEKYFLGEHMQASMGDRDKTIDTDTSIFNANMYLAEDRILCWELVSRPDCKWILRYVKSASAVTDVPDQVPELISQRRRWLNGSFFAAIHSVLNFYYIYRSSHSWTRKFWIHIQLLYQCFNIFFAWFSLANYYISFIILTESLEDPTFHLGKGIHIVNVLLNYLYLGLLIVCYVLALGNRPQCSKWGYKLALVGFAVITVYMTFAALFLASKGIDSVIQSDGEVSLSSYFQNPLFRNIVIALLATVGLYVLSSLIFLEPWHLVTSFPQYLLMAPSYISVLNVYAFANVHDVSWGTKGEDGRKQDLGNVSEKEDDPEQVDVEVLTPKTREAVYTNAVDRLSGQGAAEHDSESSTPKLQQPLEDYYKTFRTHVRVLLWWTLSNALLAAGIVTATGKAADKGAQHTVNGYMAFILFSIAGLALVRFIGSTMYIVMRLCEPRE